LFIHILRICNKQQPSYGGLEYILQLYFFDWAFKAYNGAGVISMNTNAVNLNI